MPPKKAIGNKEVKFINERRFYLERWLKKLAAFPFLLNSKEFVLFTRPTGDIDKSLGQVHKIASNEIVDRLRESLNIEDHLYDPIQKDKLD